MSYIDELREKEKQEEKREEEKKKRSKCHGCVWGHWDGNVHFCMLPRCLKQSNKE